MDFKVGDIVKSKKGHACGSNIWEIIRIGMDVKLRCNKCHHIIILSRARFMELLVDFYEKEQVGFETADIHNKINNGKKWIRYIENPTIEEMYRSVNESAMTIRFIENPPDEIIKLAIKKNPICVQYLGDLSIKHLKFALEQNVSTIQFIKNPSNELVHYAEQLDSKKMRRYSRNKDGRFVKNDGFGDEIAQINDLPTDKVIGLLRKDANVLQFIKNPTEEMILTALDREAKIIRFVKNPSYKMLKKAVEKDAEAMKQFVVDIDGNVVSKKKGNEIDILHRVINELSKEEKILISNPEIIRNMNNVPYEMQLSAIRRDYLNIRYIKKIDPLIFEYLYDDPDFDVYSLTDYFNIQMNLVTQFEKIRKNRKIDIDNKAIDKPNEENQSDYSDVLSRLWEEMRQQLESKDCSINIISSEIPINAYINLFGEKIGCNSAKIACGFLYKSGLKLIDPIIQQIGKSNQGMIELIIGSLKDYYKSSTDNKLVSIDLETARLLNTMISASNCNVYTLEKKFYHGKYFFFEGENISFCIVGSSNLTYSGFAGNYELNTLYLLKNQTGQYDSLKSWFLNFITDCTKLDNLSECNFADTSMKFDTINAGTNIESVDVDSIENEVQSLTDDEVKFRLNLWLDKKPTNIYRNLDIVNLNDYVAFEYKEQRLIVFESFEAANGYYYFYGDNIFEIVEKVRTWSKTQIFELTGMDKRGYHTKNRSVLKKKIFELFTRD